MHRSPAVVLGCTDCHGGDATVSGDPASAQQNTPAYVAARRPGACSAALPEQLALPVSRQSAAQLHAAEPRGAGIHPLREPVSDYRVARDSCGACHMEVIEAAERSLMATGAMLLGGAAYNNGILPFKNYIFGEAYTRERRAGR